LGGGGVVKKFNLVGKYTVNSDTPLLYI